MIIQSLEMINFRQYYGKQKIEFADNKEKIVTVIIGENGRGKTGIYRAIMLAIFGDIKLDQDVKEAHIVLANLKALEEEEKGIESSVVLNFTHDKNDFILKRKYFSRKESNGKVKEQLLEVELINVTTNEQWKSENEIYLVLRKMIDERVKHYFFFDGERIERLTRASSKQKEEVAVGIKNLLKIEEVIKAKEVISKLLLKIKRELQQNSTGEYKKGLNEMAVKEERLKKLRDMEIGLKENLIEEQTNLRELEKVLKEYDSLKKILEEREYLITKLKALEEGFKAKEEQLKIYNKYLPLMMSEETLSIVANTISREIETQNVSGITSDLLDKLLNDFKCICGNDLEEGSTPYLQIQSIQSSVKAFEQKKHLHDLLNSIYQLISYLKGRQESIFYQLQEIKNISFEKDEIKFKIENLDKILNKNEESDVKVFNEKRNESIKKIIKIEHSLVNNSKNIVEQEKVNKNYSLALKELERRSGIHSKLLIKNDVLEKSFQSINKLIDVFEKELISELEIATQQNFSKLLDDSGQTMLKQVKIKEDYSIEILNAFNQPFLANISQGQRQVLSLSFITALAQVSGGKNILEMPLLMDTPFGRLSGVHQQNLIDYLPQISSQWVLLVTDREFGNQEEEMFAKNGSIGKYYRLNSIEPGVTIIEEMKIPSKV